MPLQARVLSCSRTPRATDVHVQMSICRHVPSAGYATCVRGRSCKAYQCWGRWGVHCWWWGVSVTPRHSSVSGWPAGNDCSITTTPSTCGGYGKPRIESMRAATHAVGGGKRRILWQQWSHPNSIANLERNPHKLPLAVPPGPTSIWRCSMHRDRQRENESVDISISVAERSPPKPF